MSTSFSQPLTGSTIATIIFLAILVAAVVALVIVASLTRNLYYRIGAVFMSILVVGLGIYAAVSTFTAPTEVNVPQEILATEDPFTYDPGQTSTGLVVFSGSGAALPDQYTCNLKSSNTVFENGTCNCKLGYYGYRCELQGFGDDYVSLTASGPTATLSAMPSQSAPTLTSWPIASTVSGCTNICTSNPQCLGVTYAGTMCTQYTSIAFPSAPIQNTKIDPPILDTTLYLNKSRLMAVNFRGYFDVIYGVLPTRYFVGNGVIGGGSSSVHATAGGSRVIYYPMGVASTISQIPDWIIAGTPGVLYISTFPIPPPNTITPGRAGVVSLITPLVLTRAHFPFTDATASYFVRLDPPTA